MKLLKQITAFFLLALVLVPLLSSVILQLQQLYVQHQMEEALEQQHLVSIKINAASVHWVRKNKECLINGELFDVKSIEISGNDISLTGLFDVKEKAIKSVIATQSKHQQSNQSKQIVKLQMLFAAPHSEQDAKKIPATVISSKQPYQTSFYHEPFKGHSTPPPKPA
ncbi:MAG: hypothetical protein K2X48_15480 [Chitinophagaceae bacterium]|nr:hypothetical protein [Chitinophagaceae bacterium]